MNVPHLSSALASRFQPNLCMAYSSPAELVQLHHGIQMNSRNNQLMQTQDFFLDTFFNPVWMSGPYVFSFNRDGTVKLPNTTSPVTPPRDRDTAPSAHKTYAAAAKAALSQSCSFSPGRMSTSPNTTNARTKILLRESDEGGLVYTWPPKSGVHKGDYRARDSGEVAECVNDIATKVCGSPSVLARTGDPMPKIAAPTENDDSTCASDGSPQGSEDVTLEKISGLERLRRKAPPPLHLDNNDQAYDEIGGMLLDRDDEYTARGIQVNASILPLYIDFNSGIPSTDAESGDGSNRDHLQLVGEGLSGCYDGNLRITKR